MSTEGGLDFLPVNDVGQFHQRVLGVEHLAQGLSEQFVRLSYRLLRTHSNPANICKKLALLSQNLANMDSTNYPEPLMSTEFTELISEY